MQHIQNFNAAVAPPGPVQVDEKGQGCNHVNKSGTEHRPGALCLEGRHCLKGHLCRNARYRRCITALGLRDAEDRIPIGRHVNPRPVRGVDATPMSQSINQFIECSIRWFFSSSRQVQSAIVSTYETLYANTW